MLLRECSSMNKSKRAEVVIVALVLISGLSIAAMPYLLTKYYNASPEQNVAGVPFHLTLLVTPKNWYNSSVGYQDAYFVLHRGNLYSSANLSFPANRLIVLTIINLDNATSPLNPNGNYAVVSGTLGDKISTFNIQNVNSSLVQNGIQISGGIQSSSVPANDISHTFTVIAGRTLGNPVILNIPVGPLSIVQASFIFYHSAVYVWQCEAACGSGPTGWGGSTATPGWMMGTVVVS